MSANGEDDAQPVRVDRHGVYVGGRCIARDLRHFDPTKEARLLAVRQRTPDDWWRTAAAIEEASEAHGTGGPLGSGVDFFAFDHGDAIPADVRWEIEQDAYEAAREQIVAGIDAHLRRMASVLPAVSASGRTDQ